MTNSDSSEARVNKYASCHPNSNPTATMAPAFSNIPVVETPGIPTFSGLMCTHPKCYALFVTLRDAKTHATNVHSSKPAAVTCSMYEHLLDDGGIKLYRVLDGEGEHIRHVHINGNSP